ncbi:MAG: hypothetical protein V2J62_06835 [candidate division KSB1 bacterium]|jgi:hypothetical protein|nr:hypothetical protein [candidate division KSB1 bacterium]
MDKIGKIAFIAGVVISIIAGFLTANWVYWALTLLGLVVGFLNVGQKEVKDFLLAALALVIISALGSDQITALPEVGPVLGKIYVALLTFVSPAALIVALKALFGMAKS